MYSIFFAFIQIGEKKMNLTKPQKLIYDMEKVAGGAISVICGSMLISGKKELFELKEAVNELYRINDASRISVYESEGKILQTVNEYVEQEIEVLYFENKTELDMYAEKYAKVPFDLFGILCEIKIIILPNQYGLLAKLHHIIGDAWTLALLGTQFNTIMNGKKAESYSYIDYIETENTYLASKQYEKDKEYFLEEFKKCDEVTYLSEKQSNSLNAHRKTFIIDSEKTKWINDYAQKNGTSAFMLFTAALSIYMNRTKMNAEKFYIGTAILNRRGTKEKNTMGMFVNTVPLLIELDNTKTFAENLSQEQKTIFSIFRHQKYNYGEVLAAIRKKYGFKEKLYDMIISYQNASIVGAEVETTWYCNGFQNESLQVHIDDRDREGVFRIHYDYLTDKFTGHEIDMFHLHICNLLFDAIKNNDKRLYELELLTVEEKQKLFHEFNNTIMDYPRDKCVHQLFEEQVEKTPDKIAVIASDKTLTYVELNEQANCIAHSLIERNINIGDIVAFALPKTSYLIATILGILKSGAVYLPIDVSYPQDRIDYMLQDSNTKFIITENVIEELLSNKKILNTNINISDKDLCYCIYTSGSTGKAKGTVIRHGNLIHYINNMKNIYKSRPINMPFFTSQCVDLSITSYFLPLVTGGTVCVYEGDLYAVLEEILNNKLITSIKLTPTHIKILNSWKKKINLKNVENLIVGGEALFLDDVKLFWEKYGSHIKVHNEYGPTEATVGCCDYVVTNDYTESSVSIGKPIANTQIYIVDKFVNPVPIGVIGELCIAGDGVAAGYLRHPKLSGEKFISNPFGEGKIYKTGDLAFWQEDGNIVYVGRNDFQVKIRGLRIELEEIENVICSVPDILQAVVVVRKNNEGRQFICAFYTGMENKNIRNCIGEKLPKYMVPHVFTHLEEIPLTISGKVDRKGLPEIDFKNIANNIEHVAPETEIHKNLCKLMELVLGIESIGINDDFFDLGGDSLKAVEFVSKARNEGIYFNLQNVFDNPTVKELSDYINKADKREEYFSGFDFIKVKQILDKNRIKCIARPQKTEVGNILIAGATGYLGIHILSEYLKNDNGTAYCLVRGKNREESIKRLKELLGFYFCYIDMDHIKVVCGDLQEDKFGLSENEYNTLANSVDVVINAAANVKHYGTYKCFNEVNVESVKRLVDFCKESGAKLIHTSTLTVSGNGFSSDIDVEKCFTESDLYIGQSLENVYARSKFEAEKVVFEAMLNDLQANVMRIGNLTNRISDGVFQKNYKSNAFLKRIKAMIGLGVYPESLSGLKIEFTPVDEAAKAIMTIVRHFSNEQTVFHINNPRFIKIEQLFKLLNALNYEVKKVANKDFDYHLKKVSKEEGKEYILESFVNDLDENYNINYESKIFIENNFTVEHLKMLGFEWSDIEFDYISKYIRYFEKLGYLR